MPLAALAVRLAHPVSDGGGGGTAGAWDISTATFLRSGSVAAQDGLPGGVFIKPDGTKMYVAGNGNDSVYAYDLATAWDVSSLAHVATLGIGDTVVTGVFLKSDGTKLFVVGAGNDKVYEYALSTPWDLSTASLTTSFVTSTQDGNPRGVTIKADGTKMFVTGVDGDSVYEYDLATAWDVSSATFVASKDVSGQDANPWGLSFKDDGTKMFIVGPSGDSVYEYDLSVTWDVTSATFSQSKSLAAEDGTPTGLFMRDDGLKMYVTGFDNDSVYEYDLGS